MPQWAYGKEDAWSALASRWLGDDPEFKALSERNKANRGSGGTHCAGARNHDRFKAKLVYIYTWNNLHLFPLMFLLDTHNTSLAMQEADIGEPVSDMQAWERMKMKKIDLSEPQPSFPEYYGTDEEDIDRYVESFKGLNPEVDRPLEHDTDERAMVLAGHGWEHGRLPCLSAVIPRTPELGLTRIKATLTADDPPVLPPRQPSRARPDVSFSQFYSLSAFVPS